MNAGQSKPWALLKGEMFLSSLLVGVFFILGVIGLLHHAMWRDETYPWLMARFSDSLRDHYLVARYDLHFMLWHLVLWVLTRFTHNCQAMQWLHLALATSGVWLVLRFGPFTKTQKILYCFGYFVFFEYCLVCREYVCIVLLMFGLCALCAWRKDSFVGQALIVFLLSNINIYATLLAFSFVAASVVEHIHRRDMAQLWATRRGALIVSGLILCAALLSDGLQTIKPHDAQAYTKAQHSIRAWDFVEALSHVWRGYVPIPYPFPRFQELQWESNFLLDFGRENVALGATLSLALLAVSVWTLRRSSMAVAWYLSGTSLLMLFQSVVQLGALRHHGFYYILYLACVWSRSTGGTSQESQPPAASRPSAQFERFFLSSLLAVQVVAGVYVWILHLTMPFSGSKLAADFIRQNGYANLLIVGSKEPNVSSVTAYLDRPIYYPDSARFGTWYLEATTRLDLSSQEVLSRVAQLATKENGDMLLVLHPFLNMQTKSGKPLQSACLLPDGTLAALPERPVKPYLQISLLAQFRQIVDENYSLYLIRHRR